MADLAIQMMTVSLITSQINQKHDLLSLRNTWSPQYDYIVVGAGSAGAVVANRLTEDQIIRVLLLEVGGPASVATDIPGYFFQNLGTKFDWSYSTVPQSNYGLSTGGIVYEPSGKVIGGTSALNAMAYSRGNRKDFDNWSENFGAKGWSYEEVLPLFIKSENNSDLSLVSKNRGFHGTDGPLSVSSSPNPQPIFQRLLKAMNELGLETVDMNGAKQLGTSILQSTIDIRSGLRASTGNAYIDPNPHPNNLDILTNALVTKILFSKTDNKIIAIGVQFIKNNITYEVMAKKEIIISGGTFNSPQLLMLSGIGPKEHLNQMKIELIADLPVGHNLQDHPLVFTFVPIKGSVPINQLPHLNEQQLFQLYTNSSGPLSRNDAFLTYFSTQSNPEKDWPNTCFGAFVGSITAQTALRFSKLTDEWTKYFNPYIGRNTLQVVGKLARVRSNGTLRLASINPLDQPLSDPKFLTNPQDLEDMTEMFKFVFFALLNSSISASVDLIPGPIPGCQLCPDQPIYRCDSYIKCLISQLGGTGFHSVGTCRMGQINRTDVVVDERLRVKNISGLRVCDASVMPQIPNAPTNAPAIMIGEKCAQMIKQDSAVCPLSPLATPSQPHN